MRQRLDVDWSRPIFRAFRDDSRPLRPTVTGFSMRRPAHETAQDLALAWLSQAHAYAQATREGLSANDREAFAERLRRVIDRCACDPSQIGARGHVVPDVGHFDWAAMDLYDVTKYPRGRGTRERSDFFAHVVDDYFEREYASEADAPSDLLHVTCTGYVSPSGAQRLIERKGWGHVSRVTHAYHMGCYAAFPAIRLAIGCLAGGLSSDNRRKPPRVDIVHTELCSLHLDPTEHSIEQLVVQSLFGDGFIRYSIVDHAGAPGLSVLSLREHILPDSAHAMSWTVSDAGMTMTLARDVPERIGRILREFVTDLFRDAGLSPQDELPRTVFAVHPGGPRIIDSVRDVLELSEAQVRTSREVLFDHGNMSSATLPHVWMRIVADPRVAPGTCVASLAFGPGLTVCGGIFRKVEG